MKDSLRRIYIKKRNDLSPDFIKNAGIKIADNFISSQLSSKKIFMSYYPIKNEAPVMELAFRLFEKGKLLTLPTTMEDDSLKPAHLTDFTDLTVGKYKIPEPRDRIFICPDKIEVIFVPGVVFDRSGGRTGYGKGCYDRFLEGSKTIKIGVCYAFQILDELVSLEQHDIRMDYLLTEEGIYEV